MGFPVAGQTWDMGTIKALIGIVVIVGMFYCAWQIVPPELANYSFQDDLRQIAMVGGANPHQSDQDSTNAILKKAQEHQIALAPEQITVTRIGTPGCSGGVCGGGLLGAGHVAGILVDFAFHPFQREPRILIKNFRAEST